ncbi:hypothetical protein [Actinoplanes sp. URMC 104]|uniref:hypothetical protein n=1 Tax=Actinoplanes sp. URMC 104 TaxID=3423409 RepID=UPI003F19CEA3
MVPSTYRPVFLIAAPLAWAVVLLWHPTPDVDAIYSSLRDDSTRWLVVHFGTLLFIGLTAVALDLLVHDLPGPLPRTVRWAAAAFALFYGAAEAVIGIAAGVLVRHGDAAGAQALWDDPVSDDILTTLGGVAWVVAVLAAALALHRAGASPFVPLLLILSSAVVLHGPPIGPLGLLSFAGAALLWERRAAVTRTGAS